MQREDISFLSGGDLCNGWLYRAESSDPSAPLIILGHGLGATKDMRLPAYAERFAAQGWHAMVFDYRGFGDSGGYPRYIVSRRKQLADWDSALRFGRTLAGVDRNRIAIFGSSYGGGLVINTAVRNPDVAAVIAQCPFTDGLAAALVGDRLTALKLGVQAARDLAGKVAGRPPHLVPVAGPPGTVGFLTSADAPQYLELVAEGVTPVNRMAARFAFQVPFQRPGAAIKDVSSPLLLCVCDNDLEAPAKATLKHAAGTSAEVKRYPLGHFEIYQGEGFEQAIGDQIAFLSRHLAKAEVAGG